MRLAILAIIAVGVPALEIVGIYLVGSRIGFGWTVLWLLATIFIGLKLIQMERTLLMSRLFLLVQQNQSPLPLILASGRRIVAGILFIIPGPFSDALALLLLLWPSSKRRMKAYRPQGEGRKIEAREGDIIEGKYRRED
jgi:UPF0716 protein FxsA